MNADPEARNPFSVLVVEDDPASVASLEGALELFARATGRDVPNVTIAGTVRAARASFSSEGPFDLVVLDLGLPDGWGHEFLEQAIEQRPDTILVVHTVFEDDSNLFRALSLGASGYLLKGQDRTDMARTLEDLDRGAPPLSPAIARRLLGTFRTGTPPPRAPLTPKELEIVQYLARGLTNAETADCLGISAHTVSSHIKSVYRKLHVSSRAEMTGIAERSGWVSR